MVSPLNSGLALCLAAKTLVATTPTAASGSAVSMPATATEPSTLLAMTAPADPKPNLLNDPNKEANGLLNRVRPDNDSLAAFFHALPALPVFQRAFQAPSPRCARCYQSCYI